MPVIYPVEQRTEGWHRLHLNRITASNFKIVMDGSPKAWARLMDAMRGEGRRYTARSLAWGESHEDQAVAFYELETGNEVERIGFATHSEYEFAGSSPDGLVGVNGGIEVKCPYNSDNHVATIELGMPEKHVAQVQGNIWVMEREWWDFVSFDPRCPPESRMYVQRVYRDDAYIKRLEEKLSRFWDMYQRGMLPGAMPQNFDDLIGRKQ